MKLHFATIPMHDREAEEEALNAFLGSHRVVGIERQFVADGPRSAWAVCVSWVDGDGRAIAGPGAGARKGRVDYREALTPEQFAVFVRLRELRKGLAERDGVPPYAVVTNEQMAEIVRRGVATVAELGAVEGVGPSRVEKYGAALLAVLQASRATADAAKPSE
jgi:superfamily II DNA helicase RecQ